MRSKRIPSSGGEGGGQQMDLNSDFARHVFASAGGGLFCRHYFASSGRRRHERGPVSLLEEQSISVKGFILFVPAVVAREGKTPLLR